MEEKDNNEIGDVQSLLIKSPEEEKKEEENFDTKMDSLFSQLDAQMEKVKRYAIIDLPLDQVEINQYKFKYTFQPDNNVIITNNNENLIEFNNNNENNISTNKDNNENDDKFSVNNKKLEIKEIKDDEEMKKKMYEEMTYKRMEEERKIKEIELEKKREKNIEEEKRIKQEQKKREEDLLKREKEIMKKEEELKRKEKEIKMYEEERRKKEEEEANEKLLKEEEEKLKKEEEEKEKEEQRESDRIKKMRMLKEQQEKEEKERKQKEKEVKNQIEKIEKEKEDLEQQKLKQQIENKKIDDIRSKIIEKTSGNDEDELKIEEINDGDDDSIKELGEDESSITKTKIEKNKNDTLLKSNINLKSVNPEANISKLKAGNKTKMNNQSRNRHFNSPTKKSFIKESTNKPIKKPKEEKTPLSELFKEKKKKEREDSDFAKAFKESKIYSKIKKEIIDNILKNIYAIDDFEEKKSEYDDVNIYPSITEFDKEEKNLKEKIPEFENGILNNEKLNVDDRMRKYFTEEEAFENDQQSKKINDLLSEVMRIPNESHMNLLAKKFEKENLKNLSTNEFENIDSFEEIENKLFEKEEFYPDENPVISNLENLQTFIYKYKNSAEEKPDIMVNSYKYFNYWRPCLNDGNSFYRVIIFALMEHCILQKDSKFFDYLLNEICGDEFIKYYKKKNINYEKSFRILSVIWLLTQNQLQENAFEILIKGFNLKDGCLDLLLITYLKKALINFGEEINKLLEEKKKSGENLELIEETKIDLEQIENMYLDPPKLNIFDLISELYNINIQVYLLGGNYLSPTNSLRENDNFETSPTFVFGYFFSGYHILYNPEHENDYEIFKNIIENDNPQLCRLTHELKDEKKCDICFKETKHIVFLKKKFIVCKPCLLNHLKETIKKRSEYFFEDKCLGQEYYSRPIHLQDDFYIDDFEYSELLEEENIINSIFSNNNSNKCADCDKMKSDEVKLIKLDCKCRLCEECLENIIMQMTKDRGYLLPCEYLLFNSQFKCECEKLYPYKELVKFYTIKEEQKELAKERASHYIDTHCLICFKNLLKDDDVKKVKIKKEKEDDKDHFICNKCYCKHFRKADLDSEDEDNTKEDNDEDRDDNEVKVIKDDHKIKCIICDKWHHYLGNVEGCGCNIF